MNKSEAITKALLAWYDQSGRALVFRGTREPYRVWLSEIMLQQTRTATVEGYYTRFLALFPDVFALAAAREEAVLKAWEGLGYYSRARHLHRCAKQVAADFGGVFPHTAAQLLHLPGIGPYTAAAIASIAFDEPIPAMDGNLQRVISRLYLVEQDIGIPSVKRLLFEKGQELMPSPRAGDMNQAMMDLGATICLPGTPDCARCPIAKHCLAYQDGEPERLPLMARKKPPRAVPMAVLLITFEGRVLVRQRAEALLRGLYVFPLVEGEEGPRPLRDLLRQQGLSPVLPKMLTTAKHVFTHRVWQMRVYHVPLQAPTSLPDTRFVNREEMQALPFPTAMKAAMAEALRLL